MVRLDLALGCELGSCLLHEYYSAAQAEGRQWSDGGCSSQGSGRGAKNQWKHMLALRPGSELVPYCVCTHFTGWIKSRDWTPRQRGAEAYSCLGGGRQGVNIFEQQSKLPQEESWIYVCVYIPASKTHHHACSQGSLWSAERQCLDIPHMWIGQQTGSWAAFNCFRTEACLVLISSALYAGLSTLIQVTLC